MITREEYDHCRSEIGSLSKSSAGTDLAAWSMASEPLKALLVDVGGTLVDDARWLERDPYQALIKTLGGFAAFHARRRRLLTHFLTH